MRQALSPVAALLLGVAILLTGQGLQGTLMPVRAGLEEFSTIAIGIIGAAYFLGFTTGCLTTGGLVKRVGHVRVFAAMTALASAAPLLQGMWTNPIFWGLLRLVSGFCFAVLYVVIESWINESANNENRGVIFSVYVFITLTVLAAGQMMFLLFNPMELAVFAAASVLVSLAAVPVVLSTSPSPAQPQGVEIRIKQLFECSPAATIGCLVAGSTNGSFWALAPVFAVAWSGDISLAAWFMTSGVIGGALGQWPLGYLSDRLDRRVVIVIAASVGAGIGLGIVLFGHSMGFVAINLFGAAWGAVAFPLYSVSVAHANDHAEADDFVGVSSGLLLMYGAGAVVGPFIASAAMTLIGAPGLYWFSGAMHLLLVSFVSFRTFSRKPVPIDQHVPFTDSLAATCTASSVYEEEYEENENESPGEDRVSVSA